MFGIGFTELLIIFIVAILFLGPDKLPEALVEMAKFIKSIKKTISDAKNSFEEEVKLTELKEEALSYKKQLDEATEELRNFKNISLDDLDDEIYDDEISEVSPLAHVKATQNAQNPQETLQKESTEQTVEKKNTTVTFKKKKNATDNKIDKTEPKENH